MRALVFSIAIMCISRVLLVRDFVLGSGRREPGEFSSTFNIARHKIPSADHMLDAVLARPEPNSERAALLICHGIGETVDHWRGVQELLAAHGIVTLVFDYSGYGRSTGIFTSTRSERDAIAAFQWLRANAGGVDVSLLGFSLGSAIAASIVSEVSAQHLVLCSAFTSLREAAMSVGIPKSLALLLPSIWHTCDILPRCTISVQILHGQQDRLFPTQMASDLTTACGSLGKLVIVPHHSHDEAYRHPRIAFWGNVISHLAIQNGGSSAQGVTLIS
jgi:uncharacterized protein